MNAARHGIGRSTVRAAERWILYSCCPVMLCCRMVFGAKNTNKGRNNSTHSGKLTTETRQCTRQGCYKWDWIALAAAAKQYYTYDNRSFSTEWLYIFIYNVVTYKKLNDLKKKLLSFYLPKKVTNKVLVMFKPMMQLTNLRCTSPGGIFCQGFSFLA